jgi:hypothetical protein
MFEFLNREKHILFFLYGSFFMSVVTFGQGYTSISGKILDSQTKKPVAGVYLEIPPKGAWTNTVGTISDEKGGFLLKFPSILLTTGILKTSKVGYQSGEQELVKVKDQKDSLVLFVQTVPRVRSDSLDGYRLVSDAMDSMETSFPINPYWLTGFYRETLRFDDTLVKITEGVLKIEKTPLPEKDGVGELIKLLKGRRYEKDERVDEWESLDFANPATLVTRSLETKLPDFLEPALLRGYHFSVEPFLTHLDGKPVYSVRFSPKDERRVKGGKTGKMLIDTVSLGIVSLEYEFTTEGLKDVMKAVMMGSGKFITEMKSFTVTQRYHQTQGRYYLEDAHLVVILANRTSKKLIPAMINLDFYATEVNSRLTTHLRDNELIEDTLFPLGGVSYLDSFWGNYNFIKLEERLTPFFTKK